MCAAGEYVGEYSGTVLAVSHDEAFVSAAAESIAEVAGGRLELYKSVPHAKFLQVIACFITLIACFITLIACFISRSCSRSRSPTTARSRAAPSAQLPVHSVWGSRSRGIRCTAHH